MAAGLAPDLDQARQLARAEKCRRELLRRDYSRYYRLCYPKYYFGWFHRELCASLQWFCEAIEKGENPRLQIWVPIQHGKSDNASRAFVAWLIGRHPEWRFILSQYSAKKAHGNSRWVRNRVRDEEHLAIFPGSELADDSAAVDRFSMKAGGQLRAAGADTGVAGEPAEVLILDDFISGREQADSQDIRDKRWDSYHDDYRVRLAEGGGILVINTRWHEDDLSGRLVAQQEELEALGLPCDKWRIVDFPAIAIEDEKFRKKGEALFPEHKSLSYLLTLKAGMEPRSWRALYQQRPTDDEGTYFAAADLRTYDARPNTGTPAISVDLAYKTGEDNDYTCMAPFGLTSAGDLVFWPELRCERMNTLQSTTAILQMAKDTGADSVVMPSDADRTIRPFLDKMMDELDEDGERLWPSLSVFVRPEIADKESRARGLQGWVQRHKVLFAAGALWDDVVQPMLTKFPTGKRKDAVDMASNAFWLINECTEYRAPKVPAHKNPDEKRWKEIERRQKRDTGTAIPPLFGRRTRRD